ncbi:MAG: hypothetical protein LUB61_04795 [Eggerthellaceae bacterium]|nr:hypothetical protein [Eggerthellaceae bacterium]
MKHKLLSVVLACLIGCSIFAFAGCSSDSENDTSANTEATESTDSGSHLYDNATTTERSDGQVFSEIDVPSSEVTDEALYDWYENYVKAGDYDYYLIAYTDNPG